MGPPPAVLPLSYMRPRLHSLGEETARLIIDSRTCPEQAPKPLRVSKNPMQLRQDKKKKKSKTCLGCISMRSGGKRHKRITWPRENLRRMKKRQTGPALYDAKVFDPVLSLMDATQHTLHRRRRAKHDTIRNDTAHLCFENREYAIRYAQTPWR